MPDLTVSKDIDAAPQRVWDLVSDLPRMGDWSPENNGGEWIKGASGPAIGALFRGRNSNGAKKWETTARVTSCEPGTSFGFHVFVGPVPVADWRFDIEQTGAESCRVTETWTERRPKIIQILGKSASGVSDRKAHNKHGMEETLRLINEHFMNAK